MRRPTLLVATALTALTLAACGSDSESTAEEPTTEAVTVDSIDTLDTYLADTYDGEADEYDGEITAKVQPRGTKLQDQNMTATILENIGDATLDYDTLVILAQGEDLTWSCRYTADTINDIAERSTTDGTLVITEIWDEAETCAGAAGR